MSDPDRAARWERYRADDVARLRMEVDIMRVHAADVRADEARRARVKAAA